MDKVKIIALAALFVSMLGLAYHIETKARPIRNVQVETQHGESHEH
jgi:hypothetical protein